jgi:replicative DNA helicase
MSAQAMPPDEYFEPTVDRLRVPPHDLDAEAMVLSEILIAPERFALVADTLKREDFYSESNGRIYEAIFELTQAGTAVDIVSVKGWLRDRERLAQVGGASYLAQLIDFTPVAGVEEKAARIVSLARARELIATAQRIAAEGYSVRGDDVERFLDESAQAICQIAQKSVRREAAPLSVVVKETYEKVLAAEARQGEVELPTGLVRFDKKIGGLGRGRLTVVAARPGMGKTSLATGAAEMVASLGGLVLVFSLEMPRDQLVARMACCRAEASVHRALNGWMMPEERSNWFCAADEIRDLPIWFDDTPGLSLMGIRARCRNTMLKSKRRLSLVIVDYLQLMEESAEGETRDRQLSIITSGLKRLAKELDCAVLALSQLNRGVETRPGTDKRPRLSDLRESGAIEQDADDVVFVYRDEYYNEASEDKGIAELIVAKQRNGPTGVVRVGFDGPSTRFRNLHEEMEESQ